MRKLIQELCSYASAGVVAFAVDFSLLLALVKIAGWHYLLAATASFAVGGVVLYFLCIRFVFRFRRIGNRALELPYFVGLGVAGLLVNSAIMYIAVDVFGIHFLVAKSAAAMCTFVANYLLRRLLLFSSFSEPK